MACLVAYVGFSLFADQTTGDEASVLHAEEAETVEANYGVIFGVLMALAGLVGVVFGAKLLVDGGVTIAREFGISETVIGLSIVAVGTSLPELATSAIAAFRGKADVALAISSAPTSSTFSAFWASRRWSIRSACVACRSAMSPRMRSRPGRAPA